MIVIHDEDVRGNRFHTLRINAENDEVSIRGLIKLRIETEIGRFNMQRPVCFFCLVQPENSEVTPRGFRLKEHREINWQTQFKVAQQAFEKKHFIVNVNGKDVQSLDDTIKLDQAIEVIMIKCMDIVGG